MDRIQTSYQYYDAKRIERVNLNEQPPLDLTSWQFMLFANVSYLLITYGLYQYMKRRDQPFQIKPLMIVYNAMCVCLAGYVVVGFARIWWEYGLPGFVCNSLENREKKYQVAHVVYVFYLQKFFEYCDTWFFILRKSFRQVTFLHIYHHASISIVIGTITPLYFGGDMYLAIILNSIVHVVMYSHYLVTALGMNSWWRPYLTMMQLIQFVLISLQNIVSWNEGPMCGSPDFGKALMIGYMMTMLYLFSAFFQSRYMSKPSSGAKKLD